MRSVFSLIFEPKWGIDMRNWIKTVLAISVCSLFVAAALPAEAARRDGLANSELIEDKDDIFTYPQLALDYGNLISFEYGNTANTGNAMGIFSSGDMAGGYALQRGGAFEMTGLGNATPSGSPGQFDLGLSRAFPYPLQDTSAVGNRTTPLGASGAFNSSPHMIFDLFGAYDMGTGKLGVRASVGTDNTSSEPASGDSTSSGAFYAHLKGGYTADLGEGSKFDSSLSLLYGTADRNNNSGDDVSAGSSLGLGIDTRYDRQLREGLSLGVLGDLNYTSTSVTQDGADDEPERSTSYFGLQAGAGPVYDVDLSQDAKDGDKDSFDQSAEIATYGVLGYQSLSLEPNSEQDDDESSGSSIVIPGVHLAAEFHLLSWLYFRSGAQYWFQSVSGTQQTSDGEATSGGDNAGFGWSSGLGIEAGQFRFDGSLTRSFMRNGPNFVSGASNPLFATASAQFRW